MDAVVFRCDRRDDRLLEWASCNDNAACLDYTVRGFDGEALTASIPNNAFHLYAGPDRCVEFLGVCLEVVGNAVFRCKRIWIDIVKFQAWEAVVPCRPVGDQRVPAASTPSFSNTIAFQYQMRDTEAAQVLASRNARLAGTYNERVDFFFLYWHF